MLLEWYTKRSVAALIIMAGHRMHAPLGSIPGACPSAARNRAAKKAITLLMLDPAEVAGRYMSRARTQTQKKNECSEAVVLVSCVCLPAFYVVTDVVVEERRGHTQRWV